MFKGRVRDGSGPRGRPVRGRGEMIKAQGFASVGGHSASLRVRPSQGASRGRDEGDVTKWSKPGARCGISESGRA